VQKGSIMKVMEEFNIQGRQTSFYKHCPGTFGYKLEQLMADNSSTTLLGFSIKCSFISHFWQSTHHSISVLPYIAAPKLKIHCSAAVNAICAREWQNCGVRGDWWQMVIIIVLPVVCGGDTTVRWGKIGDWW
jgi:hypothetical protein